MAMRTVDFRCPVCGHEWEEIVVVTSTGQGPLPRCPQCRKAFGVRQISAPAIRTNDNMPRDQRTTTTAGHLKDSAVVRNGRIVEAQLGRPVNSREDVKGLEVMSDREFASTYLHDPDRDVVEKEFCDDPENLEAVLEDAEEVWQKAESGTLPPAERPMTDLFRKETGKDVATVATEQNLPITTAEPDPV